MAFSLVGAHLSVYFQTWICFIKRAKKHLVLPMLLFWPISVTKYWWLNSVEATGAEAGIFGKLLDIVYDFRDSRPRYLDFGVSQKVKALARQAMPLRRIFNDRLRRYGLRLACVAGV